MGYQHPWLRADLSGGGSPPPTDGLRFRLAYDCHLMNFGAFGPLSETFCSTSSDFDETLAGVYFTADLKRRASPSRR
jgi:uncharacterized protein (DUF2252 family)